MLSFQALTPDSAYVLGLFAADGNITINKNGSHYVEFTSTDKSLLTTIRSRFGLMNRLGVRKGCGREKDRYRLQIGSKALVQELMGLGFPRQKCRALALPHVPDDMFPGFVRGYFDGDGNVLFKNYPRKNRPSPAIILRTVFTSCSRGFLTGLHRGLLRLAGVVGGAIRKEKNYHRLVQECLK